MNEHHQLFGEHNDNVDTPRLLNPMLPFLAHEPPPQVPTLRCNLVSHWVPLTSASDGCARRAGQEDGRQRRHVRAARRPPRPNRAMDMGQQHVCPRTCSSVSKGRCPPPPRLCAFVGKPESHHDRGLTSKACVVCCIDFLLGRSRRRQPLRPARWWVSRERRS
jgi:hypothetical protein